MKASNMLKGFALSLAAIALASSAVPASAADLVMWERSGGNKDMVDKLVEMWNAKHPDRHINLTYIPHAEMVAKLAQAIASGDVPDLMGMDLIYAPQFEKAGQLVDITDSLGPYPFGMHRAMARHRIRLSLPRQPLRRQRQSALRTRAESAALV